MRYFLLFVLISITAFSEQPPERFELKTKNAKLVIDKKNILTIISDNGAIEMSSPVDQLSTIALKNINTGTKYSLANGPVSLSLKQGTIYLSASRLLSNSTYIPAKFEFRICVKDDAFCFSGTVNTTSKEWQLTEVKYPNLSAIQFKDDSHIKVYWPNGLGQRFDNPNTFGQRNLDYPSGRATMPWYSINTKDMSVYVGSHDTLQGTKRLSLTYDTTNKKFSTDISASIYDTEYSIPDILVKPYSAEWYTASKFYRDWYDRHFKIIAPPDWVRDNSGWLLAILKQQNMEVMWPYKQIDKLCDIAQQYNLGTIGLFGWGYGGHDHLYPFYTPDNSMGGRKELEKAIARARKRGIRIIIYANGKIMDSSTDFYKYYGGEAMLVQPDLKPQIQYYIKQKNSTPVIFAQACDGSDVWRRTMYDLAVQAATLGADGILYDQLGVMDADPCFSENHDHAPGATDPLYRVQMVDEAREKAREINPEFIVMTEAANDLVSKAIDYTHGWGYSYAPNDDGFPELLRYTFPEFIATQRNTNPMITRTDANYAALYGLRHEIESRYPGDVDYLVTGKLPTIETYANVVSPPSIKKMNFESAETARQYLHSLIEFETIHSDFFRKGKFVDGDSLDVKGENIIAKGFKRGNKTGVVIWNQNLSEARECQISMPGYHFLEAFEPQKKRVNISYPLAANSIRLMIFEKD